jgi:hypothetical protein
MGKKIPEKIKLLSNLSQIKNSGYGLGRADDNNNNNK